MLFRSCFSNMRFSSVCMAQCLMPIYGFLPSIQTLTSKVHHNSKTIIHDQELEKPQTPNDNRAWENWEFGEESVIFEELENDRKRKENENDSDIPMLNGIVQYKEAYQCLKALISNERLNKMNEVISHRSGNARFVFEDPVNLSNVWACLRTLDSFGIQYVDLIANPSNYFQGKQNKRYRRMNSAMGTQKWLDIHQYSNAKKCISNLKTDGWTILATDLNPKAQNLLTLDYNKFDKFAIVMGNEEKGISDEMRELCDHRVYLPMKGFAQSFSLSVGCASIVSHLNTCGALKKERYGINRLNNHVVVVDDDIIERDKHSDHFTKHEHSSSLDNVNREENITKRETTNSSSSSSSSSLLSESEKYRILCKWAIHSVKGSRAILRRAGYDLSLYPTSSNVLGFKTR